MRKTRFTQMVVLVCIGSFAGCTSGEGGTVGNTELNVIVPNGAANNGLTPPEGNNGSSQPGVIDIQDVEYTINCEGTPSNFLDDNTPLPGDGAVQINGNLEVVDGRTSFASGKACNGGDNNGATCAAGAPGQAFCLPGGGTCDLVADFGPNLRNQSEVWQGFMDLPEGDCTVQLRARDNGAEVICTATENFTILADSTTKVNVLMICDVSFQAPVGMLDLDGSFSFVVGNFCPDLFVLNCNPQDETVGRVEIEGFGTVAAAGCQVRARDVDSTCGENCDPQYCPETPEGLGDCFWDPDRDQTDNSPPNSSGNNGPDLTTVVVCTPSPVEAIPNTGIPSAIMDCNIDAQPDFVPAELPPVACLLTSQCDAGQLCAGAVPQTQTPGICVIQACPFSGDVTGTVGQQLPSALNPGEGGYAVAFTLCDETFMGIGLCQVLGEPLASGATMTCVATTTDGDDDCVKTKSVTLTGPGDSPCVAAGCNPGEDCAFCDDSVECTIDQCDDSSGAAVCVNDPRPPDTSCDEFNPAEGLCNGPDQTNDPNMPADACILQGCNVDADCRAPNADACSGQAMCNQTTLTCDAPPPGNIGMTCDTGVGSGDGTCALFCNGGTSDGLACTISDQCPGGWCGACQSNDACLVDGNCPNTDGNVCTAPTCDTTGSPWTCGESAAGAEGDICENDTTSGSCSSTTATSCTSAADCPGTETCEGAGTCQSGSCAEPPVVGSCDDTADWRALPKECPTAVWDPDGAGGQGACSCPDTPGADVPDGGSCGPFSGAASVVLGCEAPGGVLNAQLALDVFVSLAIQSAADDTNVDYGYRVEANAPLLSDAAALTTVDGADVFSDVTGGSPVRLTTGLNPDCAGEFLGVFTQGTDTLLLDADPNSSPGCTINGVELLPDTTAVTPSPSSTNVEFNFSGDFAITLTLSSGDQIIVDGAGCTFDNPTPTDGSPVICPVQ